MSSTKAALPRRERELGTLVSATEEQLIPSLELIGAACAEDGGHSGKSVGEAAEIAGGLRAYLQRLLQFVSCTRENPLGADRSRDRR